MENSLYFLLTAAISTGSLLAATKAPNPWPYFGIMALAWSIFVWRVTQRLNRRP